MTVDSDFRQSEGQKVAATCALCRQGVHLKFWIDLTTQVNDRLKKHYITNHRMFFFIIGHGCLLRF